MNDTNTNTIPKKQTNLAKTIGYIVLAAVLTFLFIKVMLLSYNLDVINKGTAQTNEQMGRTNKRISNLRECLIKKDFTCQEGQYVDNSN